MTLISQNGLGKKSPLVIDQDLNALANFLYLFVFETINKMLHMLREDKITGSPVKSR